MEHKDLLPVENCCVMYNIEYNFLEVLQQHELIEIINISEHNYVYTDALNNLERMLRLHFDLNINIEGIEAINHLLLRVKNQQQEITYLKNKLKVYENE